MRRRAGAGEDTPEQQELFERCQVVRTFPPPRSARQARFANLLDIATFTADRWGEAQAERYITRLFDCFERLVENPDCGALTRTFRRMVALSKRGTPRSTA